MTRKLLLLMLVGMAFFLAPQGVQGQTGVGVNVGSIEVDENLSPGGTYKLPPIGVVNPGHVSTVYSLRIVSRAEQEELKPPEDWFSFNPSSFRLEEGESQNVVVSIKPSVTARPGDYFAFIEAFPMSSGEGGQGGVALGIAAATKLSFTVKPSNVFSASFLWFFHRFRDASPWSWTGVGIFGSLVLGFLFVKFVPFRIQVGRR